jgi:uncharacterized protein (TIGR00269 family)
VINLRQHKLALCAEHFDAWFLEHTARALRKYRMIGPDARVLVAVSGGKDSLALWEALLRLGYHADGLHIDLGIDDGLAYSARSRMKAEAFAGQCAAQFPGTRLTIVDLPRQYGESIPQLATRRHREARPCSLCGLVKRHEMNRIARDLGYNVLATGHNLDDEAAVLFGNTLAWEGMFLLRQGPVLPEADGLARKVKPLCRFYEREMAAYALLSGIEYIYEECPFAEGSTSIYYKELLNQLETTRPGAKLTFYLRFLEARASGLFREETEAAQNLHPCTRCGQPTTAPDLCSFCRMIEKVNQTDAQESQ